MRTEYIFIALLVILLVGCRKEEDEIKGIVSFSETSFELSEDFEEEIELDILVNRVNHNGGTVQLSIEGGSYGEDYVTSFGSEATNVNIAAGEIKQTLTLQLVDDEQIEENMILNVALDEPTGSLQLGANKVEITVIDDDTPIISMVNLPSDTLFLNENDGSSSIITIVFEPTSEDGGTIELGFEGDAVMGEDYTVVGGSDGMLSINVNMGSDQTRFVLDVIDNQEAEGNKIIDIEIKDFSERFEAGENTEMVIVIVDDD